MKQFTNFIFRIASWKSLLIFLILYLFFSGYILKNAENRINELAGKEIGVIDLTFGFNPQQTLDMVADYGDAARTYYSKVEMTADLAYPVIYAFLFAIILALIYRNTPSTWVIFLPFGNMLLDYAENIFIVGLLNTFPGQSATLAVLCELFKMLKWMVLGVILILIVMGLINLLLTRNKRRIKNLPHCRRPPFNLS